MLYNSHIQLTITLYNICKIIIFWKVSIGSIMSINNKASDMVAVLKEYDNFIRPYHDAINEVVLRLQALNKDYKIKNNHNPIHQIQHRVKSLDSIVKKLDKRGYSTDLECAKEYLTDISGVRVICYYNQDVYTVAKALKKWKDMEVVRESDYIQEPKRNGYRSLHMIIVVPVHYIDSTEYYPVEIQLRTMTMDCWASIEHQLHYKSIANTSGITDELKQHADNLHMIGLQMEALYEHYLKGKNIDFSRSTKKVQMPAENDADAINRIAQQIRQDIENDTTHLEATGIKSNDNRHSEDSESTSADNKNEALKNTSDDIIQNHDTSQTGVTNKL